MANAIVTNDIAPNETAIVNKQDVKEAPIKWGLKWITSPTPAVWTNIFRFVLYAAFVVDIITDIFGDDIPAGIAGKISSYSIKIVTGVHALSKTFGIDLSGVVNKSQNSSTNN